MPLEARGFGGEDEMEGLRIGKVYKERVMERVTKGLQWLATLALVVAGVLLLVRPMSAHAQTAAFVPARFTVVDAGTAGKPDVVLIPGLSSSRAVWDAEAKLLAPNYRLHLVQVNGFAGAPAGANATGPILPGIVEELHGYIAAGGMKPVVVGHSLGGLLALMLTDKYPGDVRRLVIVDTLPYYAVLFNPAATVETAKPMADGIRSQMIAMPEDKYEAMLPMMVGGMVTDPAGRTAVLEATKATDRTVAFDAMYDDLTTDLRADVANIQTPTLVLFAVDPGAKQPDPAVYEAAVRDGYKAMPHVTLVKVEPSKHFIMYDQPAKLDAALEGFLK
jgi:pimeloyl-ACP methyl ester carboxylesterase